MGVPNIFANATTQIPLVQLDQNFATNATVGTSTIGLGNTTASLNGLTSVGIGMTAVNPLDITKSQNAPSFASFLNATTGTSAYAGWQAIADETSGFRLVQTNTGYNAAPGAATDPVNIASCTQLIGGRGGGIALVAANGQLLFYAGSQTSKALAIATDGGMLVGNATPTGGSKGLGTINVGGGIYLNGSAYTNPDYVFEHWVTGKIKKFADKKGAKTYRGLRSLDAIRKIVRRTFALPGFGQNAKHDLFSGSEKLLEVVEEAYIHLFNLSDRISELESRLNKLEKNS